VRIDHIAIWTEDLDRSKEFYEHFFGAHAGHKYLNAKKNFESYFLSFASGPRLEIMKMPNIGPRDKDLLKEFIGLAHMAISVGSKAQVDLITEQLRASGYAIVGEPRTTGDGYYESVVLDPDGNRIEVTV
jgi:lactoylglutathione lyase